MAIKNDEISVKGDYGLNVDDELVKLVNLTKVYYRGEVEITALDDVTFTIQDGDFITIQGPSGCGKTTLLNMIGLMDHVTKGDIYYKGRLVSNLSEKELDAYRAIEVGFIFQLYNLIPHLDAKSNVAMALGAKDDAINREKKSLQSRIKDLEGSSDGRETSIMIDALKKRRSDISGWKPLKQKERVEKSVAMLKKLGLGDRIDNFPDQLSGGERQRVTIARALVKEPSLILADEPTGDLDTETGSEILDIIKDLNEKYGHTVLLVTHDSNIGAMGKRRVKMEDYKIVSDTYA